MTLKKKQYNAVELFAGCGGLLDGLKQTGKYKTLACVEWEKKQCGVLRNRLRNKYGYENADDIVVHFDIQRTEELINGFVDEKYGESKGLSHFVGENEVDLITGGPPCQAYSLAGRVQDPEGMKNDYRNYLCESYLKLVVKYKPKMFVFENVEGLLSAKPDGFNIIEQIRRDFSNAGYQIIDDIRKHALIDFSEYGVPQKRKRVVLVGLNREYFPDAEETLIKFYTNDLPNLKVNRKMTVGDALGGLPPLHPLEEVIKVGNRKYSHSPTQTVVPQHEPRYHNKRDIGIFRELSYDIESGINKYSSAKSLQELYTSKTGKKSNVHKYYVLRLGEPSNTIPAHLKKDGLRHIHPDSKQSRSITVREAARLQSFDDDFIFSGVMSKNYEMIGNAVPPKFASKLGLALESLLEKATL